jgi:surface polysaccharide O-acyltransferase-like enzyme
MEAKPPAFYGRFWIWNNLLAFISFTVPVFAMITGSFGELEGK